ncbi:DUF4179 domain-containing protein [Paenibacillus terreus]|uniref:DUF4179 domain-containing protein n=1 Tax=Paenibacillus terreus TaxID=1387834 RepID=A0ABV5B880_9BACL
MKAIDLDKQFEMEKGKGEGRRQIPDHVIQRLEDTYAGIESGLLGGNAMNELNRRKKTFRPWKKVGVAAASAVVLSTCVLGTAFVSPAMAESLRQVPGVGKVFGLIGDLGLQTADEKGIIQASTAEANQDDITLKISEIIFDGTRLSLALEREGGTETDEPLAVQLAKTDLFVDGKPLEAKPGSIGGPIGNAHSTIMNFTDVQGLPDQFELTVKVQLQGSEKPFQLVTPVIKTASQNIVLKPEVQAENEVLRFSVNKVEITPASVSIDTTYTQLADKLPEPYVDPASSIQTFEYDVANEKGQLLEFIKGEGETMEADHPQKLHTLYAPFAEMPENIVIKPYVFKHTQDGKIQKQYLPELELSIPVRQ